MRTGLIAIVLLVCCSRPALTAQGDPALTELRTVVADRVKANVTGDSETIASAMTPDSVQTDISGYVQDKATWMKEYFIPLAALIKAGTFRWDVFEHNDVQCHLYGDCAVVAGALHAKGTGATFVPQRHTWVADPHATFSGTLRFTHVYVRRNGKWLVAALHNAVPVTASTPPAK